MKQNCYPAHVQAKLDTFEQQVEHLAEQVAKTKDAIASARARLGGGFQNDGEYRDTRTALDQLVADEPVLEQKLRDTEYTLAQCRSFLAELPEDCVLEPARNIQTDGAELADIRRRIARAEDEIAKLRALPTPSADIADRVREYVNALARPQISGIATGETLRVVWPDKIVNVLALLLPNEMTTALLKEINRPGDELPLEARQRRIINKRGEVDTLQRAALALGMEPRELPPAVVLGVRVKRPEQVKEAKRVSAA